jgi:hypothetical protein
MKQQIELHLGGKKRKFTFGILFLGNVLERDLYEDYNDLLIKTQKNPFKHAPILMYESLVNTCNKYQKEIDFTENDVVNWLDKDYIKGADNVVKFLQVFFGTNENKTPTENENNQNEAKKK